MGTNDSSFLIRSNFIIIIIGTFGKLTFAVWKRRDLGWKGERGGYCNGPGMIQYKVALKWCSRKWRGGNESKPGKEASNGGSLTWVSHFYYSCKATVAFGELWMEVFIPSGFILHELNRFTHQCSQADFLPFLQDTSYFRATSQNTLVSLWSSHFDRAQVCW